MKTLPGGGVRDSSLTDDYGAQTQLSNDNQPHTIQIQAENGTTLTDLTIDYYQIATVNSNGQLQAVNPTISQAAEQAGGTGDNPIDSLFRQIIDYTKYVNTSAPILYQSVRTLQPTTTSVNKTTVSLPTGLYLVNARNVTDSIPTLVYAGNITTPASGAMLDGLAMVQGKTKPVQPQSPQSKTPSLFTQLFGGLQLRAGYANSQVTWDASDEIISPSGAKGYNYDFRWHGGGVNNNRPAFCGNPGIMQADSGSWYRRELLTDNHIRTVLWYGYQGPQSIFDKNMYTLAYVSATGAQQRWATHLAVSAYYLKRDPSNPNFKDIDNSVVVNMPGYRQLIDKGKNHLLPTNIFFNAFRLYAVKGSIVNGTAIPSDDDANKNYAQAMFTSYWFPSTMSVTTQSVNMGNMTYAGTEPIQDKIYMKLVVKPGTPDNNGGGWKKGEQLFIQSVLKFSADGDGTAEVQVAKEQIFSNNQDNTRLNQTIMAASAWFKPSDLGMSGWHSGKYWFDVIITTHMTDLGNGHWLGSGQNRSPSLGFDRLDYGGYYHPEESTTVTKPTLSGSTQADASLAKAGNTAAVSDKINLFLKGSGGWTITDTNVVLQYMAANGTRSAKTQTIPTLTIPANGNITVTSPTFTPDMLFTSKQWEDGDYWFTIIIDGKNVTNTSSKVNIGTSLTLDGTKDTKEQFTLKTTIIETPDGVTEAHIV